MAKPRVRYICEQCGGISLQKLGKCPHCGSFGTLKPEELEQKTATGKTMAKTLGGTPESVHFANIKEMSSRRLRTGLRELDTVLGGGLVSDSAVLIGGDPGVGKSTILLQVGAHLSASEKVLYISAEESESQIKLRARRMGADQSSIYVYAQNDLEKILKEIELRDPSVIIIDSIQTLFSPDITSAPGSVSQVREATAVLVGAAKKKGAALFIVGHVTKEGSIAGPKVLEHLVDTVLYFEGDQYDAFRILRAQKNRFGSTNEIGVFEMTENGFREVPNPSGVFVSDNAESSGCCVSCVMEGSRAILVETQALVAKSSLGTPRITSSGIERVRLAQIMAVLEKKCGISLAAYDIYTNLVGGMKLNEPCLDLAIAGTMVSSLINLPLSGRCTACGEVTLTGEVRMVSQIEKRINEAAKLGFERFILPRQNYDALVQSDHSINHRWKGLRLVPVSTLKEAVNSMFEAQIVDIPDSTASSFGRRSG